jgi:hypothetical protein
MLGPRESSSPSVPTRCAPELVRLVRHCRTVSWSISFIGLWYRKRATGSTDEFFVGGRNVSWWLAGTSIVGHHLRR